MIQILKLFSIQSLIIIVNTVSGILITRAANFEVRANISALNAWLSFSLILLNQNHYEKILKRKIVSNGKDWLTRGIPFLLLSFLAIASLKISFWNIPLSFAYLLINTIVQFRGARIFLNYGNFFYLRINLVFYLLNLMQIYVLVALEKLESMTWLIASIIADLSLLFLYSIFLTKRVLKKTHTKKVIDANFSVAAVAAALTDSGIVMISASIAEFKELSFFVVAISCISPIIIMYGALQNRLLTDPNKLVKQFLAHDYYLSVIAFICLSIAYYISISIGVSKIFGENYSDLGNSAILIVLMGYLFLVLKICNTLLLALDLNGHSLFLTLLFIIFFTLMCIVIPNSDFRLILAAIFSSSLSLIVIAILLYNQREFWRRLFP